MTRKLQLLRGTTAQNDAFTGSSGELTVDTQTHELRVHDGSTAGGHVIPTKSETVLTSTAQTIAGVKTFTDIPVFKGDSDKPSGKEGGEIRLTSVADDSNRKYGIVDVYTEDVNDSSKDVIRLRMDATAGLAVGVDGTATCTTPSSSENSTKVATTAWCMGHGILVASQEPNSTNNCRWYRKYADGWVEQGGYVTVSVSAGVDTSFSATFPVAMRDANYTIQITLKSGNSAGLKGSVEVGSTTGLFGYVRNQDASTTIYVYWTVCGIAAS